MKYTEDQQKLILAEADSPATTIFCGRHNYFAIPPEKPAKGCTDCMKVFYLKMFAGMPPHERAERLDQIERIVHLMVEDLNRGIQPMTTFAHPEIRIEKDAY